MHQWGLTLFLTFVLIMGVGHSPLALAVPTAPSPDFHDAPPAEEPPPANEQLKLDTLDITAAPPPPLIPRERDEFFYPYRNALSARLGSLFDTATTVDGRNILFLGGAQYLFSLKNLKAYEAGADLLSDGSGALHLSQRFIFSRSRFRPYAKAGFGARVVPSDQLVAFLRYQNYQARGAVGFEHLFRLPMSIRAELELTVSIRSVQAIATFGYVWAW